MVWWTNAVALICQHSRQRARERQTQLTKPLGSLGRLENIAVDFAGWQAKEKPQIEIVSIRIFAADHGIATEGVSAFPQAVTAEMVRNFSAGGAAISVLARHHAADFKVVNVGTVDAVEALPDVVDKRLAPGTESFCEQPAMSLALVEKAMAVGRAQSPEKADIFIGGEMGIGNTTSASTIYCALLGLSVDDVVGRGTGIDNDGMARKRAVIQRAFTQHQSTFQEGPLGVLQCVGGLEIAALVGAYLTCAQRGIPCLVDGFIATAAALVALRLNPGLSDWLLFAHCSDEAAHCQVLSLMRVDPLLNMGLRLGEGSGAALALSLLKSSLILHAQMATFAEAGVSDG